MDASSHIVYMKRALALARLAQGRTSPNPVVGAVIVKDGRVVGEGYHLKAGEPHAELMALRIAGESAKGATMYVTLEPCAHYGRTPPCTNSIIEAGIAEVYCAIGDPNPCVDGKGHAQLTAAGVVVNVGLCEEEARELNRPFFKHVKTGRPYVTAKFAMSLDGKIATSGGESRWITNPASRRRGHELRNITDAIMVGAGTVIADDPELTTRIDVDDLRHPLRIVADSRGRVPVSARIFDPSLPGHTVLATTEAAPADYCAELIQRGVEVWKLPANQMGFVSLAALLNEIGRRGMLTLLVEGGGELLGSFFAENLVDQVYAFVAPIIIGGNTAPGPVGAPGIQKLADALRFRRVQVEMSGGDSSTGSELDLWIHAEVL